MRPCPPAVRKSCLFLTLVAAWLCLKAPVLAQPGKMTDAEVARRLGLSTEQLVRIRNIRGMTNEDLLQLPADVMPSLLRRLTSPNLPLE